MFVGAVRALASLVCGVASVADIAGRLENTTLQLPQYPPAQGYTSVPAFPGLSFTQPVAIVSPPGEANRLFVVEKEGLIQLITNLTAPDLTLFLDISHKVNPQSEGGLLSLAFHPGYLTNRQFFVYYTLDTATSAGVGFHDRLARFEIDPVDPQRALPESEVPLLTQYDRAGNHNGGDLHFGPDGYLYVALGDEGGGGDVYKNSQRIDRNFFSAILRLDVDRRPGSLAPNPHPAVTTHYAVPADNPFVGQTQFNGAAVDPDHVRTEFWAVGFRNPWRFSFDPATGWLYCGDVGQGTWEEINIVKRGGNYGWSYFEGSHPFSGTPPPGAAFIDPILEYPRTGDASYRGNSVTGGLVYRGNRLSQLYGAYVFGDYGGGNIWALDYDGEQASDWRRLTTGAGVVAFGTDPSNGDILFAEIGSGQLRRIIYNADPVGAPLPATLADTGAFSDLTLLTPHSGIVPYEINAPFWSDGAAKTRWFSVPDTNQFLTFNSETPWGFPASTVWIKHFDLELTNGAPESARRLETRFLVGNAEGVYGLTYRWNDRQTDATLVSEDGLEESFAVYDGDTVRTQTWHYPSRSECLACHTPVSGHALAFNTLQLNRDRDYENTTTNQILALSQMGYFREPVTDVSGLDAVADPADLSATIGHRVRSYLQVNCVQCHQPGGAARGLWDARFRTPLVNAGIINGPLVNTEGDPAQRVIVPGSIETSMLLRRISRLGRGQMPPIATHELNREAIALLEYWITNTLVTPVPQPDPEILDIRTSDQGFWQLLFTGQPGTTYRIEYSFDLRLWEHLTRVAADAGGQAVVADTDVAPGTITTRFYRVVWP